MTYTFENNTIQIIRQDGSEVVFIIDPTDPEPVYDRNNALVGYTTFNEHKLLAADFTDVTKLEYFVNLLNTNPSTAYSTYLANRLTL
jgi:hypothetical protein